jgi:triosephosphate isomerase
MRKKLIAGNWKMHRTPSESEKLAKEIRDLSGNVDYADVVICPTYVALDRVTKAVKGSSIQTGAQDMHWENQGAFTGKISGDMIKDLGVHYVIIGHSEQRSYFHETNDSVNKKVKKALESGLTPIICVGETLAEREENRTESVVEDHVRGAFWGLSAAKASQCVVAYEPVWAIGTGKTATAEQAQEVHAFIRKLIAELYDSGLADGIRILYGGSMKPENAGGLLKQKDIDGGLIGGAALKAESFMGIIEAAK